MPHSAERAPRALAGQAVSHALRPYVPRLLIDWLDRTPAETHRTVDGTLLFADISGFTRLTERLARHGRVGAEEMSDALNATFGTLVAVAADDGADLVKWGGDAVLLLFDGPGHAARACRAAHRMRATLRTVGRLSTSAGAATLRMSVGIHSGTFHFFLVGDPALHRELLVCGRDVTEVVALEALANAGEIAVGHATAALLDDCLLGAAVGEVGRLLRRVPGLDHLGPVVGRAAADHSVDLSVGLPVAIREHLLLGEGEPEHRTIAVAFVAFSGTDALLATRGPEATAAALDECIRNVTHAVAEYDVTFFETDINRDGGKIMLTSGAPTSSGHDAERLLRTARLIMDRAGTVPLRIGINQGPVFSGDFGPVFRRTYSVKGDAINLAARLVARAAPGQILATETVPAHSDTVFRTTALPPFTVKGKARAVTAVDIGPVGTRKARSSTGLMVGRQHEMAVLGEALDASRHGRGALVQILGEPGIGKSRLLAEVGSMAKPFRVLSVQCDEYESSTPYHSIRPLLRDALDVPAEADPVTVTNRLSTRVAEAAPHLLPWLPLLGSLLLLPVEDTEETRGLSDEFRKRRLEEVAVELLGQLLPEPTLMLVDDAQFMDSASSDLLNQLASGLSTRPWLAVVGGRESADGWEPPGTLAITTLRPAPLTAEESIHLLQEATEAHPLPRSSIATLAARAGGNPLFLESLIRAAGPSGNVDSLPESVQDLVTAQVDRLAPPDRVVLRYASVFGIRFDSRDLEELVTGHAPVPDEEAYRRLGEFVEPTDGNEFRFRHSLMREVAYEGLPYRTRQQLHDQVGRSLERADPERGSPELLSLHFFNAKRFDKAWDYSRQAGHRAREKFANQEAVDLLSRAIDSERRGPSGMVPPDELGTVFETLGDTWFIIGLPEQASDAYRKARRQLAHDPVQSARIVAKEARVDQRLRKLPQSLRRVTRALHALEQVPGRWACSARSLLAMRYAISRFGQGRVDEALSWGDQAARDAEESVDKATLAQAYATLHGIYVAAGREARMPYGELALQAYTELGDLPGQADCTNNLAVSALDHNRWVEAAETFGRAAEVYRRIGDTAGEGNAIFNQADVLVRQGHLEPARLLLNEALRTARSVSDDELVALVLREIGRVSCRSGDFQHGMATLESARKLFADIDERAEIPGTDLVVCEALLLQGDLDGCLSLSEELFGPAADDESLWPGLHRIRGFAFLGAGRDDLAVLEFEAGVAAAEEQDNRYGRAFNMLGLAMASGSQDPRSVDREADASAILDGLGVATLPVPGDTPVTGLEVSTGT
ncbi:MAG TPA: adenylate/guanylate cyclase domain-containing protein [Nocardioidaceae bacterium]|nr:adenylate/guanylate cyclase domain-containing protein [Nocardioidaceae bacterium]